MVRRCNYTTEKIVKTKEVPEQVCDPYETTEQVCKNVPVTKVIILQLRIFNAIIFVTRYGFHNRKWRAEGARSAFEIFYTHSNQNSIRGVGACITGNKRGVFLVSWGCIHPTKYPSPIQK